QADALRYLNKAYVADYGKAGPATELWNKVVVENAVDRAQCFDAIAGNSNCSVATPNEDNTKCHLPAASEHPFALNVEKLNTKDPLVPVKNVSDYNYRNDPPEEQPTYARVRSDLTNVMAQGIWVQAVRSATTIDSGDGTPRPG